MIAKHFFIEFGIHRLEKIVFEVLYVYEEVSCFEQFFEFKAEKLILLLSMYLELF